jgi:hypothetical protein
MVEMCGTQIDPDCFAALCSGIGASSNYTSKIRKQRVAA